MKARTLPYIVLIVSFISIVLPIHAQYTNVMISDHGKPNETSIIFDPNHPAKMIAACNINNYYLSADSGATWIAKKQSSPFGVWGDPSLMVDAKGSFYYFHLADPPDGNWIDRMVCQRSDDYGHTWTEGSAIGLNGTKAQDKEWSVVDRKTNTLYLTWTQFDKYGSEEPTDSSAILFAKSTDQGNTWTKAKRINKVNGDCVDDDQTVEGVVPAIGPNGEIYVSWAGPQGLTFDKSLDGGDTWMKDDKVINEIGGGWSYDIPGILRCNGLPVTKCDTSQGPNRGTIYINWTDQSNGSDDTDVWLVKSTDQGDTWSQPIRVNDDPPGKHQFLTWMDIDQTNGKLYFIFYDRRNYDDKNTDVYMATSADGGAHIENVCISDSPFASASDKVFFGDYSNIIAHNGIVRPIWTRLDSTSLSIWTALINETPTQIDTNPVVRTEPLSSEASVRFKLCRKQSLTGFLKRKDQEESIQIFEDLPCNRGENIYILDGKFLGIKPGEYTLELWRGDHKLRKKRVVIFQ